MAGGTGSGSEGDLEGQEAVSYDVDAFTELLEALEGSKKRQTRQKSVEGRRDIYAQGLASMMGNF